MWCGGDSGPHHILSLSLLTSYLACYLSMNRQGPSRSVAAHPTGSNLYGKGAPHGCGTGKTFDREITYDLMYDRVKNNKTRSFKLV
ncbi:hypothetical protein C8R44DRAFT_783636, partial [Mycena epipterygia]